ncbi:MAG: hypothetical protein ACFFDU_07380 [Candidatus Thorarchaeota archaeon]
MSKFLGVFVAIRKKMKGETAILLQASQLQFQNLLEQITYYLIVGWGVVILFGTFASALLIAIGFIYWFTGFDSKKGRNMVIGGILLFIAMQWLAFNPPWLVILG